MTPLYSSLPPVSLAGVLVLAQAFLLKFGCMVFLTMSFIGLFEISRPALFNLAFFALGFIAFSSTRENSK